jgi:hypothetical protein
MSKEVFKKKSGGKRAASSVFEEARPSKEDAMEYDRGQKRDSAQKAWYEQPVTTITTDQAHTAQAVRNAKEDAERRYHEQVKRHQSTQNMTQSDRDWFHQVTQKGTIKDKLAAYAMAVQESPFHSLSHVEAVLKLAGSENRHEHLAAAEVMTDILVGNDFLPKTRKLYYLHQRPITSATTTTTMEEAAVYWFFEDQLKTILFSFLRIVEQLLQDTVEYNRERATRFLFDLVMACPVEQQQNTFSLLANKLGDPHKKLSSRIIFYLEEIVKKHPAQVVPVVEAVKGVITRPAVPERAQYYGLTFFSQLYLSQKRPELTVAIMSVYTIFFKSTVVPIIVQLNRKVKGGKDKSNELAEPPRLAKVILSGINRALPYLSSASPDAKKTVSDFFEPLLKLSKMSNVNTAILSLTLLCQLSQVTDSPLHRNIIMGQLGDLVGEWVRLSRFSNSYQSLFALLDRVVEQDGKADGKLEKLVKRVVNSAVHMDTNFCIRALLWLERAVQRVPRLAASITLPPETVEDVRDSCLFELVALARHFDETVSSLATYILNRTLIFISESSSTIDPDTCSNSRTFLLDVTDLTARSPASKLLVKAFKAAESSTNMKNKKGEKAGKKQRLQGSDDEGDVDEAEADDFEDEEVEDEDDGSDLDFVEDEDDLVSGGDDVDVDDMDDTDGDDMDSMESMQESERESEAEMVFESADDD